MNKIKKTRSEQLLQELREREKELRCIYEIDEILSQTDISIPDLLSQVVKAIPQGWQYPDICLAKITYEDQEYCSGKCVESVYGLQADIIIQDEKVGSVDISYTEERPKEDQGPFLKEEQALIHSIARHVRISLQHRLLKSFFDRKVDIEKHDDEWVTILELLRNTDSPLLERLSRKMTNFLFLGGSEEAKELLEHFSPTYKEDDTGLVENLNQPRKRVQVQDLLPISERVFQIAVDTLGKNNALQVIQKWIREEKSSFLVNVLGDSKSSLNDISDAIGRYHHLDPSGTELSVPRQKAFRVSLVRRLLSDQTHFINVAKNYFNVNDFYELLNRVITPAKGSGKLGGKSAGVALADKILKASPKYKKLLEKIKTPKTWYITSDGSRSFLVYNNLEDVFDQKYKEITQVQFEYPHVIQVFKNSHLPPEIVKGLALALDDFGASPLIVRSSSLLEDGLGAAFAGKYRSVFIANQGSKQERLIALIDAISEVYASMFGPDPIKYRAERNLLDFHEEMGIMIQEVVGKKVGHYYFPAYAGVAFSKNDFLWSPRIKPEDGLIRLVPGLGTSAVDRVGDDYPALIAPGQPKLSVNATIEEQIRYSPKAIDVINLTTNSFETIDLRKIMSEIASEYPNITEVMSILDNDRFRKIMPLIDNLEESNLVVTFDVLKKQTHFIEQMHAILKVLEDVLGVPVDIEFASDGDDLYLLQCRPQSYGDEYEPVDIPAGISKDKILFSANRYVSNGLVKGITHVVYVDPANYSNLGSREELLNVGRAVGKLNQLLPRRCFILMGPGRWGSRGDIKMGVNVTYSDISNTAMLIEIARKQGSYVPDLSFGTHFFQDLVEASIRYLPLYPDEYGIVFNDNFFSESSNILRQLLPEYASLEDTIKVIDVKKTYSGQELSVYMNSTQNRAEAHITDPDLSDIVPKQRRESSYTYVDAFNHWKWRLDIVKKIAGYLDPNRFGVKAFYIFGSVKNSTAGPESDIDILIHFQGTDQQRADLLLWLKAWSLGISEMNFLCSGIEAGTLLDIHLVTDKDIEIRSSFAAKINAVSDAALPLEMGHLIGNENDIQIIRS
ncbi:MAG: nucleotidyltransferase domain-containing protein [Candidatus Marinimicrobia bacterium]|nr:nucleotidyltransferase domain-containing protein [Candidatus Neomarinimicrobiota bacterium]